MRIAHFSHSQGTIESLGRILATPSIPEPAYHRARIAKNYPPATPPQQFTPRRLYSRDTDSVENWVTSPRLTVPSGSKRRGTTRMSSSNPTADEGQQRSMLARQRAKEEGQPPKPSWFPQGYRESLSQWWENVPAATAEHKLMSFIPYLKQAAPTQTQTGAVAGKPGSEEGSSAATADGELSRTESATANTSDDPYGPREWRSELVRLSGKNRALNEFSVQRSGEEPDQNLVILHGYGAGLGFFYLNFEGLSRLPGWKVYALDLLGYGRSSRPPFKVQAKIAKEEATREAEDFFIDALEEWRIKRKLDRFTLMGHSLGGYLAAQYALKYPGHINKLILASPVGIPEDPYAEAADLPDLPAQTNEASSTDGSSVNSEKRKSTQPGEKKQRPYPWWLTRLWDANVSPFSLVRWAGPMGSRLTSGWTSRRFGHLPAEQSQALHTYTYSLFKQRGSGEYALAYILAPGAFARSPLIKRIANVGRQTIAATGKKETGYPVLFMYGDKDWMSYDGGVRGAELLNAARDKALKEATTDEERRAENGRAKVKKIANAGHHLYLEGEFLYSWTLWNKLTPYV